MSEVRTKYLLARVRVPTTEGLDELADRLTRLITGFTFEPELTGRFEEVPACVAQQHEMEFILMGTPEDEIDDGECVLKFVSETDQSLEALLAQDTGGFVRRFVVEKPESENGFLDYSQELAQLLVECGIPGCKPIMPVGS